MTNFLRAITNAMMLTTPAIATDKIIEAMDPWTLACAVGAQNGTIGTNIGFDVWLRLSRKNWMPQVLARLDSRDQKGVEAALRAFVTANANKNYQTVLREMQTSRGLRHTPVLEPGESMTVTVGLGIQS